ncbi:hypothetical protein ACRWC3_23770, partial [Escherichia coli]
CPLTDFGGKTSIFSHPVYLFLRKFSLQDSRGGSVRKDAAFGVTMNGVSAAPGESKNVQLDLGLGDSRSFPIFPSTSGVSGTSEFMLNIEELK